jgi:hypothetical protein
MAELGVASRSLKAESSLLFAAAAACCQSTACCLSTACCSCSQLQLLAFGPPSPHHAPPPPQSADRSRSRSRSRSAPCAVVYRAPCAVRPPPGGGPLGAQSKKQEARSKGTFAWRLLSFKWVRPAHGTYKQAVSVLSATHINHKKGSGIERQPGPGWPVPLCQALALGSGLQTAQRQSR